MSLVAEINEEATIFGISKECHCVPWMEVIFSDEAAPSLGHDVTLAAPPVAVPSH